MTRLLHIYITVYDSDGFELVTVLLDDNLSDDLKQLRHLNKGNSCKLIFQMFGSIENPLKYSRGYFKQIIAILEGLVYSAVLSNVDLNNIREIIYSKESSLIIDRGLEDITHSLISEHPSHIEENESLFHRHIDGQTTLVRRKVK